jgi:hypothetical protein
MKRLFAVTAVSAVAGLSALAGTASATSLLVTLPCGCQPLHAGQLGFDSGYTQPVGVSVTSPATGNPSGTASIS